jgi:hypothetical protein
VAQSKWTPSEVLVDNPPAGGGVLPTEKQVEFGNKYFSVGPMPLHTPPAVSTPLAVYSRSYDLIKSGWIKGYEAVTAEGHTCAPESEEAVKWCVIGSWKAAIHYEPELVPHDYMYKYMNTLWNTANLNHMINLEHPDPPQLNDKQDTEHTLILRCYEKVIAHLIKHPESNQWYPRKANAKANKNK